MSMWQQEAGLNTKSFQDFAALGATPEEDLSTSSPH